MSIYNTDRTRGAYLQLFIFEQELEEGAKMNLLKPAVSISFPTDSLNSTSRCIGGVGKS